MAARTYTINGSLVTVAGVPFDEGRDDFLEFDLVDDDGDALDDADVVSITATLRSRDSRTIINNRDDQNVMGVNGGTLSAGTFRIDLSGDGDLVAVGTSETQKRELTVIVTHHTDKVIPIVVRFDLRAFTDVG